MNPAKSQSFVAVAIGLILVVGDAFSEVSWTPIGPGGGGWLSTITVVDDPASTVYVGCDVGGIYKSTDHGSTWEIKNSGLSCYYVQDLAYDPQTPSTLYAGTRNGVFKSTDGAESWTIKRAGFPPENEFSFSAPVSDLVVDPNDRSIIYAGIGVPRAGYELDSHHWEMAGVKGAVYKSTDFGESWTLFRNTGIDTTAMIYSLAVDSSNSNVLYAATSRGVYKSDTAGATWVLKSAGLPHLLAMGLVIDPDNSQILYTTLWAEPGTGTWEGGVYKSITGGDDWFARNSGLPQVMGTEIGFTSNFPSILIDKNDTQTLYVGNNPWTPDPGVYKTTDGGESWDWISRADPPDSNVNMGWITQHGTFVRCMAMDPNHSNRLFFGTSTHLFRTEDAGGFWDQVCSESVGGGYWQGTGMETTCIQDIVIDPNNSQDIYAGYWDMGFLKSNDGGVSFKRTFAGMQYDSNTFSIIVDPAATNIIYAATGWWEENKGEVCKSTDFGETWTILANGIPDATIWSIALDEASAPGSRTLYAASFENGIYKTVDGGQTWFSANNGLGVDGNLRVKKIIVDPNNSDILFAGIEARHLENESGIITAQGGLFKSVDAGSNWIRVDLDLPQINVLDIEVDPNDSQKIFTAVSGDYDHTQQTTFFGGVYKSVDGGSSWTNNGTGFGEEDNLNVKSVALCPTNSSIVYSVTSDAPFHDGGGGRGIFKSTDGGSDWVAVNDGLGVLYFSVITIDPLNPSLLYAGSGGNGIFKGVDSDLVNSPHDGFPSGKLMLVQNSPNPFNPQTLIKFVLPGRQDVTLRIYDVQGRLVRTLLEGGRDEGSHAVVWSGEDDQGGSVASGVYFYRLSTEDGDLTRKMALLK